MLKVESMQLRALPTWLGELENLRSLAVSASLYNPEDQNTFIREIPASIGDLGSLRELKLLGLINVKELPEGMKKLTGLEVLSVENCGMQKVPVCIGEMEGLRELILQALPEVEELPEELGSLTRLHCLRLVWMDNLRVLKEWIGRLTGLKTLELRGLWELEDMTPVGGLTGLENLAIGSCPEVEELPEEMGMLTRLQSLRIKLGMDKLREQWRSNSAWTSCVSSGRSG